MPPDVRKRARRLPDGARAAAVVLGALLVLVGVPSAQSGAAGPAGSSAPSPDAGTPPPWTAAALATGTARAAAPAATAVVPRRLVVLGDSVPAGWACTCPGFGADLATHESAALTNDAVPGLTSQGLLDQLNTPEVITALGSATLVTVTVGANDFLDSRAVDAGCADLSCYRPTVAQLANTMGLVMARISALTHPDTKVVLTGYWNVFRDGTVGTQQGTTYVATSDALTRTVNASLARVAAAYEDIYTDLYAPFKGNGTADDTDLLSDDGDHPNTAGQAVIASAITHDLA